MPFKPTHGLSRTKHYLRYRAMVSRCTNKNDRAYKNYGGRGIKVCERWLGENGFTNYLSDIGPQPTPNHTIDRVENDGDYTPLNVRWTTRLVQGNNKRNNRFIEYNGENKTVSQWARELGIEMKTLHARLRNMSFEQAMNHKKYTHLK